MTFSYFQNVKSTVQEDTSKDSKQDAYWIDDHNGTSSSFVAFVWIFSDNTATSLECPTLVAYPVHVALLNCFVTYKKCIIENGLFSTGFLPPQLEARVEGDAESHFINSSAPYWFTSLYEVLPQASLIPLIHRMVGKLKIFSIHDAMSDLVPSIRATGETPFQAYHSTVQIRSSFQIIFSYGYKSQQQKICLQAGMKSPCTHLASGALPQCTLFKIVV